MPAKSAVKSAFTTGGNKANKKNIMHNWAIIPNTYITIAYHGICLIMSKSSNIILLSILPILSPHKRFRTLYNHFFVMVLQTYPTIHEKTL